MPSTSTTGQTAFVERRPTSPHVEIAIQAVFIISISAFTIYELQTGPPWVHPGLPTGRLVSLAIAVSIGVRENRLGIGQRLLTVVSWSILVSALCVLWVFLLPIPEVPGVQILGRNYPLVMALIGFTFLSVVFSVLGMIVEELAALVSRLASRWFNQSSVEQGVR